MAGLDPALPITKPVSVWNRPLKADFKGLFGALAQGTIHGFSGQWSELGSDAVATLSALGIDHRDAPQLAWILLRRSLFSAMRLLIREASPVTQEPEKESLQRLSNQLDKALGKEEVSIDHSFFKKPKSLPLLATLEGPFSEWLVAFGVEQGAADSIARRLPSYFVAALHAEWRRSPDTYEPMRAALDTPFAPAVEREQAWSYYRALLEKKIDEPMFGEAFSLRQVYVPLQAFYVRDPDPTIKTQDEWRVAVDLREELDIWLSSEDRYDGYRIVSGGPGSGKSSFVKMYAAGMQEKVRFPVLFIPLPQFMLAGDLVSSIGEFIRSSLPFNPLDAQSGEDRLLVIFDGLDEFRLRGSAGADAAQVLIHEALDLTDRYNEIERRLLVLFTCREAVVRRNKAEFRHQSRILNVLPYLVDKSIRARGYWESGTERLDRDLRNTWWQLYGAALGKEYQGIPGDLKRPDLDEITAEPLLNYLVARSYALGQSALSGDINDIHENLLRAVYERVYEPSRRSHAAIQGMVFNEFRWILEEAALAAWHGGGRASVTEIERCCERAGRIAVGSPLSEVEGGVTRVLSAYYFRESEKTSGTDPVYEFAHQSFQDYLAASGIVRGLEDLGKSMHAGCGERQALRYWAEICGAGRMERGLWTFVQREVRRRRQANVRAWQKNLSRLISYTLRNGMPMEEFSNDLSYKEMSRWARNAEENLLAVLNACALVTREISRIEWPDTEGEGGSRSVAGAWIRELQGQRTGADSALALQALSFLDLSGAILFVADLSEADLRFSDLSSARLSFAVMGGVKLEGAILKGTSLEQANLINANLEGANLERANLYGVRLEEGNLRNASLREANLPEANLSGSNLEKADLRNASLQGANLTRANLLDADLDKADVEGALVSASEWKRIRGAPIGKVKIVD